MRKRIFSPGNFKLTVILLAVLLIGLGLIGSYLITNPGQVLDEYQLRKEVYWPDSNNLRVLHKSGLFECQNEIKTAAFESVSLEEFSSKHDPNNHVVICLETYSIGGTDDEFDIYWLETFPGPIPVTMIYSEDFKPEYRQMDKKFWDSEVNRIVDVKFGDGELTFDVRYLRQDSAFMSIFCVYAPFGMILWFVLASLLEYEFRRQRRK